MVARKNRNDAVVVTLVYGGLRCGRRLREDRKRQWTNGIQSYSAANRQPLGMRSQISAAYLMKVRLRLL